MPEPVGPPAILKGLYCVMVYIGCNLYYGFLGCYSGRLGLLFASVLVVGPAAPEGEGYFCYVTSDDGQSGYESRRGKE
jgi:hypothetical protein